MSLTAISAAISCAVRGHTCLGSVQRPSLMPPDAWIPSCMARCAPNPCVHRQVGAKRECPRLRNATTSSL
eukprot:1710726-Rhodomonas_salina.2